MDEQELTKEDCMNYLGRIGSFECMDRIVMRKERIGQAWCNSLIYADRARLVYSRYDPFFKDDWESVIKALRWLLEN